MTATTATPRGTSDPDGSVGRSERTEWLSAIPFLAVHLAPLAAFFVVVTWQDWLLCGLLYVIRMLFITAGYHRYFSHRSFRMGRVAQFVMAFGGTTAVQKGPLWWAGHHRLHHRYTDLDDDVHSPRDGFWWSHVGWILSTKYKAVDLSIIKDFASYPELRFLEHHSWIGPWLLGVACFLIGGWGGLVIGFFLSTVLLWHGTFLVNSMAHLIGRRRYATPDTSRNSMIVALITGGEGWHNNHHYLPASARQGFTWWEIDPTWYVLKALAAMRVVRDLKDPPARLLDQARVRDGAFDIGMFRVLLGTGGQGDRRTNRRSERPTPRRICGGRRAAGTGRPWGGGTAGRAALASLGFDLPGPGVGRRAGRLDVPDPQGRQGGVVRGRGHRQPLGMTARPAPAATLASASLWIVDLDGVVWLAGDPIGDVGEAVTALRARGKRVVFATNNSAPTTDELLARLERAGIAASADDLATSAAAAASLVRPGQSAKVLGEGGVLEALAARGVKSTEGGRVDAAIVGWSRSFDFDTLAAAAAAARTSGRLIGTNEDPTHPTPDGLVPGSGALLAAVSTASGVVPEIAGKPHEPMAALMKERFGFEDGDPSVVMVGDQPRTDGRLAERLAIPFALVDSGVTPAGVRPIESPVAVRAPDLVSLVQMCLADGG